LLDVFDVLLQLVEFLDGERLFSDEVFRELT